MPLEIKHQFATLRFRQHHGSRTRAPRRSTCMLARMNPTRCWCNTLVAPLPHIGGVGLQPVRSLIAAATRPAAQGCAKKSATQGCSEFAQGAMSHTPIFGVWPLWNFCRGLQGLPMGVRGVSNRALVVAWREFEVGQKCVFRVRFFFRHILKPVSITTHPSLSLCVGMCLHAP